jgi:NhaP-type Na+/H+ or K+/H+ antiporter
MTAYMSYLMGDVLGLSGILALFACAVAISHYALHNISSARRCMELHPEGGSLGVPWELFLCWHCY